MLPQPVLDLLAETFPDRDIGPPEPTFGGFSNLTVALRLGGEPLILKAASDPQKRADLRREAAVLRQLGGGGLPVAPLLALLEGRGFVVELLGPLPGESGIRQLGGPPELLARLFGELGALLARVHATAPAAPPPPDMLLAARAADVARALPALALGPAVESRLLAALARAARPPATLRLAHGDPGAHNLLWDGRVTALLDWEWAGWGDTAGDLAWVRWTVGFRQLPEAAWAAFLAGYGAPPPPREDLRDLALAQIASILVRIAGQMPAREEWLRRLDRTLADELT